MEPGIFMQEGHSALHAANKFISVIIRNKFFVSLDLYGIKLILIVEILSLIGDSGGSQEKSREVVRGMLCIRVPISGMEGAHGNGPVKTRCDSACCVDGVK